jgi:PleD family two-component response regulator
MLLGRNEGVTMSIGIGTLMRHKPVGADQLVATADAALYDAKGAGRDRIITASNHGGRAKAVPPVPSP